MILYILIYVNVLICLSSSTSHYPQPLIGHQYLPLIGHYPEPLIGHQHWPLMGWWLVSACLASNTRDLMRLVTSRRHCHMSPPRELTLPANQRPVLGVSGQSEGPGVSCVRQQAASDSCPARVTQFVSTLQCSELASCSLCHSRTRLNAKYCQALSSQKSKVKT